MSDSSKTKAQLLKEVVNLRRQIQEISEAKEKRRSKQGQKSYYFRSLIFNLHEDIIVIGSDHKITDINNTFMVTTGLKRKDVIGRKCYAVSHGFPSPCSEHGIECNLEAVFSSGRSTSCRHIHRDSQGRLRHVDILLSPLKDETGRVTHVIEAARDISDLIHAQKELEEEKDKANLYLEIASVIMVALDRQGRVTLINRKGCELLGYSRTEVLGKNWFTHFIPKNLRGEVRAVFRKLTQGQLEPVESFENRIITKDGRERIISWHNTYLKNDEGKITGTLSSGEDITERKAAEESLRRNEERLNLALEASTDGIYDWNFQTGEVYFSPRYYTMLDYAPDEFPASYESWRDLLHPEDKNIAVAIVHELIEGRTDRYETEFRMKSKEGRWKWILSRGKITLRDRQGNPLRMLGTHVDITVQKKIQMELSQSRREWENIFQAIGHPTLILDPEFNILAANRAALSTTKMTLKEIQTKKCYQAFHDQETPVRTCPMEKMLQSNRQEVSDMEVKALHGSFLVSCTPVRNAQGKLEKIIHIATDISAQKRAEDRIKASLKEKEVLLKEIHHRVKNNMQVMISLLRLQASSHPDTMMKNVLRESQGRIRSMALIHERLYQSQDFNHIDFKDYLNRMILHLISSFDVPAGQVRTELDVRNIYLNINTAIPCGLLINELVSNALKYAFPNQRKGRIFISMSAVDTSLIQLRIGDDGVGMPPGLDFQNTHTLGLQLVNDLVKQLQGKISKEKKEGTVFNILFSALS